MKLLFTESYVSISDAMVIQMAQCVVLRENDEIRMSIFWDIWHLTASFVQDNHKIL